MNLTLETDNQQLSVLRDKDESSETISRESRENFPEAVPTLTDNAEGNDIVHKNKAFEGYIIKANQMFNNKFDYSKFIYVNAKTKGIITCPTHGEFTQNMDKHTTKNSKGCPNCWKDNKPYPTWLGGKDIISFDVFKEKANKIFQNQYEYDEESYSGLTKKTNICCKKHGIVKVLPVNFLKSKRGCPKCGEEGRSVTKTKSSLSFLNKSQLLHDNKYDYPNIESLYKNRKSVVQIVCPKHGLFLKQAQKHLQGQGCFHCRIDSLVKNNILVGGYSENLFSSKPELKNKPAIIYLLRINNFYKIGITTVKLENRIKGIKAKAKLHGESLNVSVLTTCEGILYDCFLLEQRILQENENNRFFKKWSTELLKHIEIEKYF